jgi:hypothetical protein
MIMLESKVGNAAVSEINNWKFSLDQKRWLSKGFIMA